jgi:hypothetical protein
MFARIGKMRALNGMREIADAKFAGYFSDAFTEVNLLLSVVPIPLTAARITILRPVAIKQYSIAVAPD